MNLRRQIVAIFLGSAFPASAQILEVLPGVNNTPISRVIYTVDGSDVIQSTEAGGVVVNRDAPVYLKSVQINDGGTFRELDSFNSLGATVTNVNFTPATGGVGVFDNGSITTTGDLAAYQLALAATTQDTDLLNYSFYDGVSNMPGASTSDYDMIFQRAFNPEDFILVSERWGNTYFTLTALDANGDPIAGTNLLRFGYPTGGAYTRYDWNSGYAASTYQSSQAMAFTVARTSLFFESTSVTPQSVFGFRIDNNGEADVKFFGLSDNPFGNNPPVPEPSSALLALSALAAATVRRKR